MSKIQRWDIECCYNLEGEMNESKSGDYILHADIVKVFEWMVEHRVEFVTVCGRISWFNGERWLAKEVHDGDYLAAIVGLMGGEE